MYRGLHVPIDRNCLILWSDWKLKAPLCAESLELQYGSQHQISLLWLTNDQCMMSLLVIVMTWMRESFSRPNIQAQFKYLQPQHYHVLLDHLNFINIRTIKCLKARTMKVIKNTTSYTEMHKTLVHHTMIINGEGSKSHWCSSNSWTIHNTTERLVVFLVGCQGFWPSLLFLLCSSNIHCSWHLQLLNKSWQLGEVSLIPGSKATLSFWWHSWVVSVLILGVDLFSWLS